MDARVKFHDSTLNMGLIILLVAGPVLHTRSIQLQFAADGKQLATPYPACVCD